MKVLLVPEYAIERDMEDEAPEWKGCAAAQHGEFVRGCIILTLILPRPQESG